MLKGIENTHRSNHSIFFPQSYGSPFKDITRHISGLGLRRLDFERCLAPGDAFTSTPLTFSSSSAISNSANSLV